MIKTISKASLLTAIVLGFSSCANTGLNTTVPPVENLTTVNNIKVLPSMKDVGFEWSPIYDQNVEGYKIFRKKIKADGSMSNDELIATIKDRYATHFSDGRLEPNTEYIYTFATFNKEGMSKQSSINVKTQDRIVQIPFIQAITGLPNKIKVIWRPHNDTRVVKYYLYRQNANSDKWYKLATINNRLSAEYIDNVKPNVYAKYRVSAVTFDGVESAPSAEVEAISKILPPQIMNITATTNLPKKVILSWDAPQYEDFSHYKIYYSSAALLPYFVLATTTENSYEDIINDDGVSKYYYVTMVDKDGLESAKSNINVVGMSLEKPTAPALTGFEMENENTLKVKWINTDNRIKTFKVIKNGKEFASDISDNFYIDRTYSGGDVYQVIGIDEFGIESKASSKLSVK